MTHSRRTMRAIGIRRPGGPEVLELLDVEVPHIHPTSICIRVSVSGVSFLDVIERRQAHVHQRGFHETAILGHEVAGTVTELGPQADGFTIGQRVCAVCTRGGYGEFVAVPANCVFGVPNDVTLEAAGTFPLAALTAWHLVNTIANVRPEHSVLIHAAAGGVGIMLCQLAKRLGATVIGTVGADSKVPIAKRFGADEVINYERNAAWCVEAALDLTNGNGVDAVFDGVGATTIAGNIVALRRFGHLVLHGEASGHPDITLGSISAKSIRLTSFWLFNMWGRERDWRRGMIELQNMLTDRAIDPCVTDTYEWGEARQSHHALEERRTSGKLALIHN